MRFFCSLATAESIARQCSEDDPDWRYVIVQCDNATRALWVVEIRDEDGTLLGAL